MGIQSFSPSGANGINTDIPPAELPPGFWTRGHNVQFQDGSVTPCPGDVPLHTEVGIGINWGIASTSLSDGSACWLLGGATRLYMYRMGTITDITRAVGGSYTLPANTRWNGGYLGSVVVVNNFNDVPQAWLQVDPGVKVVPLANWPANLKARVLRSFKSYLLALGIVQDGQRRPTTIRWSHPADPGAVPSSWDIADPTKDAGEYPLSGTPGDLVDCLELGDINIIYKEDSVWGMQHIGGMYIFRFWPIFKNWGMRNPNCVAEIPPRRHIVFTGQDLIVHDGQTYQSIASGRVLSLINSLSVRQLAACYVTTNVEEKEAWLCYRSVDSNGLEADRALAWNWETGTFSTRDLANYSFVIGGSITPPAENAQTWANVTGTWGTLPQAWGIPKLVRNRFMLLGMHPNGINLIGNSKLSPVPSLLERDKLGLVMRSTQPPDMTSKKKLLRLWPRITGRAGDVVRISIGVSDGVNEVTEWLPPEDFILGTDKYIDPLVTGKLFGLRLESVNTMPWKFSGTDVEAVYVGAG